jgi:hypothetical protein
LIILDRGAEAGRTEARLPQRGNGASRVSPAEKHRNDAEQGEAGHDRRALREAAEISNQ